MNAEDSTILDSRAAVYEKLGRTKEALLDSKKTIELSPDKWQVSPSYLSDLLLYLPRYKGYARSARLFQSIKKFDRALMMVKLAIERVKPTDTKRRVDLEQLRDEIQAADAAFAEKQRQRASRSFYHFGKLPVEIAATIFTYVVEADHTKVITLSHVCREWRYVVTGTPSLWGHLVLCSSKRAEHKARLWVSRSKGKLKALTIRRGVQLLLPDPLRSTSWNDLRSLCVEGFLSPSPSSQFLNQLLVSTIHQLHTLELDTSPLPLTKILRETRSLQLRTLACRRMPIPLHVFGDKCESLVSLLIHDASPDSNAVLWTCHRNPGLESLDLWHSDHLATSIRTGRELPEKIELGKLTRLSLGGRYPLSPFRSLVCSELRELHFHKTPEALDSLLRHFLDTSALSHLEDLSLERSVLSDPAILVTVLQAVPHLRRLSLTHLADIKPVLDALSATQPDKSVLCSSLSEIDFSHCPSIRDGPLIRMVKLHIPEATPSLVNKHSPSHEKATSLPSISKITSLTIDGCSEISAEILPWLRQHVQIVRCQYATKKQAGWKR